MIDILIPVLDRPQNVRPLIKSMQVTKTPYSPIFICSPGDDEEIAAVEESGERYLIVDWTPEKSDYTKKMNLGFRSTENPFVLLGSDDIDFKPGWDKEALAVAEKTGAGVVATNDCANPGVKRGIFGTHCLVRRSYVEQEGGSFDGPGYLMHEGYDHNWCDRELCDLAHARGQYAFAEKAHIVHRHPNWGSAEMDSTYRKGLSSFRIDGRLFSKRARLWR